MTDRAHQRNHPPITRHRSTHRHASLDRVVIHVTERNEVRIEPRQDRQPTTNRRQRQPFALIDRDHRRVCRTGPLNPDELQHVTTSNLERIDVNDREEHLQVIDHGQRRVRPQPGTHRHHARHTIVTDRANGRVDHRHNYPSRTHWIIPTANAEPATVGDRVTCRTSTSPA